MSNSTIGEVCDRFSSGKNIAASKITSVGKYPVFGGNGLRGYTDSYNFDGECAIIGRQGAYCGNVRYFYGKAYMTEHAIVACANNNNSTGYLAYKLSLMNLQQYQGQSAQPGLSVNTLSKVRIDMPEKDVQIKIFDTLKIIDDKIQINNNVNAELDTMAKTIYNYWFLQFEFPNEEGKPYKSSGGKMVWNEELKREIPEGWKVGRLNNIINGEKGGDWGKESREGNYSEKVMCIRGADFPSMKVSSKLQTPVRYILSKNKNKILEKGDLIIEISGGSPTQSTGRICYINENLLKRFDTPVITSNFCKAITLQKKEYQYWFYLLWKMLYDNGVFFKYEGKTTGIKNLLFDILCRDYQIIMPKDEVLIMFNNEIEILFETIQKNLLENQELVSIRDFLLPLLMNAQITFGK
mgnify:CR=1 FL=1